MDNKSLSQTRWKCQYHIVFIPKYRKKALYGRISDDVRVIIATLCKYKNVEIIAGAVCLDYMYLSVAMPPKDQHLRFYGVLEREEHPHAGIMLRSITRLFIGVITMKRIVLPLFVLCMIFSLSACGSGNASENANSGEETTAATNDEETIDSENADSDKKATIITNDGETVEMTADELIDAYDSNEARFKKLYEYAEIKFTGTINHIDVNDEVVVKENSVLANQNKIVFDEGWCLVLGTENDHYDLADFMPGDVVTVTTSIFGSPYDSDFLREVSDYQRVVWLVGNDEFYDEVYSTIETVIKY